MKKLLLMPFAFFTLMAIMISTAVGTTSCMSAHERDSIKRAERVAVLKNELTPGYKLMAIQELGDFDMAIMDVKGICEPDKQVLYLALDSISYETNVTSNSEDGKWKNVLSFEPDSMVISFGDDATITKVIEEPLSSIQGIINTAFETDLGAATKVVEDAANVVFYTLLKQGTDATLRLEDIVPEDLQTGKFSFKINSYYPNMRGGMDLSFSQTKDITIRRDGEGFAVK